MLFASTPRNSINKRLSSISLFQPSAAAAACTPSQSSPPHYSSESNCYSDSDGDGSTYLELLGRTHHRTGIVRFGGIYIQTHISISNWQYFYYSFAVGSVRFRVGRC